jgi:hypothetical protein
MNLEDYFDRYGIDVDGCAVAILQHREHLDPVRRSELMRALNPDDKSAAQSNLLNLVGEAQENLELARKLRNSITGAGGQLLGTVSEVSKTLMAVDKCLDGASKRFSTIYSIHSMQALEDSVKEVLQELDNDTYERFMTLLEDKLRNVR